MRAAKSAIGNGLYGYLLEPCTLRMVEKPDRRTIGMAMESGLF